MWHVSAAKTSVRRRIVGHPSYPCLSGKTEDETHEHDNTGRCRQLFKVKECDTSKRERKKKQSENKAATLCRDVLRSTPTLYLHVNPSTSQTSHSPSPLHPSLPLPPTTANIQKKHAFKPWCSIVCTRSHLVKSSLSTLVRHHDFAQSCAGSFVGDTIFVFSPQRRPTALMQCSVQPRGWQGLCTGRREAS